MGDTPVIILLSSWPCHSLNSLLLVILLKIRNENIFFQMYCTKVGCRIVEIPKPCKSPEDISIVLVYTEGKCRNCQNYCQCQCYCKRYNAVTGFWKKMKKKGRVQWQWVKIDTTTQLLSILLFLRDIKMFKPTFSWVLLYCVNI